MSATPYAAVQGMQDVLQWLSVALPAGVAGLRSGWERLSAGAGGSTTAGADAELMAHLDGVLELADGTLALANVVMLSSTWLNAVGAEQFQASRDRMRAVTKAPLSWLLTHLATLVPQLSGMWSWLSDALTMLSGRLPALHVCEICVVAGEMLAGAHSVVAKLSTLALTSATALTGKKEKRSYALVNDAWSLLVAALVGIGNRASCPAGSGKLACWDSLQQDISACFSFITEASKSIADDAGSLIFTRLYTDWGLPMCISSLLSNMEASLVLFMESWQRNHIVVSLWLSTEKATSPWQHNNIACCSVLTTSSRDRSCDSGCNTSSRFRGRSQRQWQTICQFW